MILSFTIWTGIVKVQTIIVFYVPVVYTFRKTKSECLIDFDLIVTGYSVSSCISSLNGEVKFIFPDGSSLILINCNIEYKELLWVY